MITFDKVIEVLEFYRDRHDGGLRAKKLLGEIKASIPMRTSAGQSGATSMRIFKQCFGEAVGTDSVYTESPGDAAQMARAAKKFGDRNLKIAIQETIKQWPTLRRGSLNVENVLKFVEEKLDAART